MVVGGTDLGTGQTLQFPVPNNDPKSNKYDPKTDLDEKVRSTGPVITSRSACPATPPISGSRASRNTT